MKKKIILFGSSGQLGSCLRKKINKKYFKIKYYNSLNGNIADFKKIKKIFLKNKPDIVINTAAITNVDFCETNKKLCYKVNTFAVKNLSQLCFNYKALLIQFSTDYIFNSNKKIFFNESSSKNPINYYGKCKQLSESEIIKSQCRYLILRISWLYSKSKNNFLDFFINAINNKKKIDIVQNCYSAPTSTRMVVKILNIFLLKDKTQNYNHIFNISCNGITSWKQVFLYIYKSLSKKNEKKLKINFVSKLDSWKAKRPYCSKLSCKKVEKFLNIKIPFWKKELNHYLYK
jgi:dTDP-4-dehydrorhamnose reductase